MTPDETVMVDEVTAKILRKLTDLRTHFAEATGKPEPKEFEEVADYIRSISRALLIATNDAARFAAEAKGDKR